MIYLFVFAISFMVVYLSIPPIRYAALRFSIIDRKNSRKIHKKIVTKLGGLGIYFGILAGLIIIKIFDPDLLSNCNSQISGLIICSTLILLLGIYDDFQGSNSLTKLITQIVVSALIVKLGFRLEKIVIPNLINIDFGKTSTLISILWLTGISNAINLIDGLDGLASGIIAIASIFFCLYGLAISSQLVILISLAILGANLAFLRYNFYPAKIFMGDTGSLFLGFLVGCLAIYRPNPTKNLNNLLFSPAVFLLLIPIIDAMFAIIRRLIKKRYIFTGDSSHMHHYYLKLGYNQTQTVIRFYIMTFALGLASLLLIYLNKFIKYIFL